MPSIPSKKVTSNVEMKSDPSGRAQQQLQEIQGVGTYDMPGKHHQPTCFHFSPIWIPLTSKEVNKQHGMTMESGIKTIYCIDMNARQL